MIQMQTYLKQIQDRRHRLVMDKVKPLPGPKFIQGDQVINKNGKLYLKTTHVAPGGFDFNWRDGSVEKGYLNEIYKQKGLPANTDADDFLAKMDAKQENDSIDSGSSDDSTSAETEDSQFNTQPDDSKWKLFNGKPALDTTSDDDSDDDGSDNTAGVAASRQAQINNDIQLLEEAWQNYEQAKITYQTTDLEKLLELESTYSQVDDISMTNDSSKVLTLF